MGPDEERFGGPDRDRTGDLINAIDARSQLRYRPTLERSLTPNPNGSALRLVGSNGSPPSAVYCCAVVFETVRFSAATDAATSANSFGAS